MSSVFDLLDREWLHLAVDRAAARRLRPVCRLAGDARDLGGLERYVRGADPAAADRILLALVTRTVVDDNALAARVLLQLLLPGTRNLARRWWSLGDHDERAAAAVAAVYARIRRYPLARRPGRIAANVLLDAARDLRRAVPPATTCTTTDPALLAGGRDAAPPPPTPAALELAAVLCDAVDDGTLDRRDAQLIAQSRIAGHRVADLAARTGLGSRTLWDRRQRAERRLANWAACA
jgi:DNA-directed RNA polymerase specialized sigma24 family protein